MAERGIHMIRQATETDIPKLIEIGRRFYVVAQAHDIPFNDQSIGTMLTTLIDGENSVVYVDDGVTGTIGGMVYPYWINTDYLAGNEAFWWVDEGARGGLGLQLWTTLEKWAKSKGVLPFQMMALESSEPNRIEKVYLRRGYAPRERVFEKAL